MKYNSREDLLEGNIVLDEDLLENLLKKTSF